MPERAERFFWVRAETAAAAEQLDSSHHQFVTEWKESPLFVHWCTKGSATSLQLWLFRLGLGDSCARRLSAGRFSEKLKSHVEKLRSLFSVELKRPTLLTPLVVPRLNWGKDACDIGLHAATDAYNGSLFTYEYHQGQPRRHFPVYHQLVDLRRLVEAVAPAWQSLSCKCGGSCGKCGGTGCYECFKLGCEDCRGTGWRTFAVWENLGYEVDYSSGFPLAQLGEAAKAA